jgi:hypothetical protein
MGMGKMMKKKGMQKPKLGKKKEPMNKGNSAMKSKLPKKTSKEKMMY